VKADKVFEKDDRRGRMSDGRRDPTLPQAYWRYATARSPSAPARFMQWFQQVLIAVVGQFDVVAASLPRHMAA